MVSISGVSSAGFWSLLIAALVGAESLESVVGITGANPGQPLNLANRCQTVCSLQWQAGGALMVDRFEPRSVLHVVSVVALDLPLDSYSIDEINGV